LRGRAKRGRVARLAFWTITVMWAGWFLLSEWANYSESGSFLPPRPIEAYDEYDLLFWAALVAWTYIAPIVLLGIMIARRRA
jgi:hypothetical protein